MRAPLLALLAMPALGCAPPDFAPVSGKVTLNGKPLAGATVSFQPIAEPGSIEAGEGSTGKTNEKGEFTLRSSTGKSGARVAKHRVSISVLDPKIGEGDERPPRGGWPLADRVPKRYNADSELTFEVPARGTSKAEFPLTSP
jgi:hypothetical protein